jgi:hypothetical protein
MLELFRGIHLLFSFRVGRGLPSFRMKESLVPLRERFLDLHQERENTGHAPWRALAHLL